MLLCLFLFSPVSAAAPVEAPPLAGLSTILESVVVDKETKPNVAPSDLRALARAKAIKHGVNPDVFERVMACESMDFTQTGQSLIPVKSGPNGREDSWGVGQFWLVQPMLMPNGKPITKEIALDPEQALDIAAWHFSKGRAARWSCF